ncbi:MAG TPA: metal-dependent hydrolase [Leeuwenhoekiella sp.]|nr:metal-dependent hydrolase [Leeuwenhoekiella sp.]
MKITFYGQSTFGIESNNANLITDPFITANDLAKDKVDIQTLKADYILVTHAHQDHILDVEAIAKNTGALIVTNNEIANYFGDKGLKAHGLNFGGSKKFDFGIAKYVVAQHSSSFPDGSYGGNPGGFVLQIDGKTIYIAGDTALTMDMKLIAEEFDLDLAILPIGDNYTMGYKDAVKASDFVNCDKIIGCHYDTFPAIEIDHDAAQKAFKDAGKELHLMEIGSSMEL